MRLLLGFFFCVIAFFAQPALAQTEPTSTTDGSTSISAPVAIGLTQNLSFTIQQSLGTGLVISSSSLGGLNTNISLTGVQTASMSVPATFDVVRVGGTERITVRTIGTVGTVTGDGAVTGVAAGSIFGQPVSVVGNFEAGQLSFSIGGAVTDGNSLAPGQYSGVLTVIAQYN